MNNSRHPRFQDAVEFLRKLITVPSLSRQEEETAVIWEEWLNSRGAGRVRRLHNNVYVVADQFDSSKPTVLLNSHHDTVRPVASYTRNPFSPDIEGDHLYGLGSNDAGGSGVTLASTFLELKDDPTLPVNLILAITAAEEVMGENGMRAFLPYLSEQGIKPDMAIVGEPTCMQPAIAERGLLVLDCETRGKSGHAARNEGINAIYRAIEDIETLRRFAPPSVSSILGPIKVSVTMINSGTQHNIVPDSCSFVADVRTTDAYSNEETVELLRKEVKWSSITPRSTRIQASVISPEHPLTKAAIRLGLTPFVSPTTSDMALMHDIDSLKIGPGDSARSHTADEFILLPEINEALWLYPAIIRELKFPIRNQL